MLEIITGIVFALVAYYITEKDNENSDLYKYINKENRRK